MNFRYALVAAAAMIASPALAGDLTVLGGVQRTGFEDPTVITLTGGFDVAQAAGGSIQLRGDFSYAFSQFDVAAFDFNQDFVEVDTNGVYAHVGPAWHRERFLGPIGLTVGAQAGLAYVAVDSPLFTPIPGGIIQNELDIENTAFSVQFPVAFDFPLGSRIGLVARYRPIGIFVDGERSFDHILEAGLRFRF